jgi:hypothetical protein
MKIANFKRDADNNVVAILEDDSEVILSAGYIESNKPRVGSEYGPPSVVEEVVETPVVETPVAETPVVEETLVEEDGNDS